MLWSVLCYHHRNGWCLVLGVTKRLILVATFVPALDGPKKRYSGCPSIPSAADILERSHPLGCQPRPFPFLEKPMLFPPFHNPLTQPARICMVLRNVTVFRNRLRLRSNRRRHVASFKCKNFELRNAKFIEDLCAANAVQSPLTAYALCKVVQVSPWNNK